LLPPVVVQKTKAQDHGPERFLTGRPFLISEFTLRAPSGTSSNGRGDVEKKC
jgi:hypothetical protein